MSSITSAVIGLMGAQKKKKKKGQYSHELIGH